MPKYDDPQSRILATQTMILLSKYQIRRPKYIYIYILFDFLKSAIVQNNSLTLTVFKGKITSYWDGKPAG